MVNSIQGYSDIPSIFPKQSKKSPLVRAVHVLALITFNCFTFYNGGPWFWTVGFFAGVFAYDLVKNRITDVFARMHWMWILPTTGALYALSWPATITMQAILTGLDMGSRWSFAAQGENVVSLRT